MRDVVRSINKLGAGAIPKGISAKLEANFNFNAGVTQEALPQVKQMMNDAIYELKREIPTIVAVDQRDSLRRMGGR